jgi:cell division protein FtsW
MRLAPRGEPRPESDTVRRHRPDYQLLLVTTILILIGLVTLFAIGPRRVAYLNGIGFDLSSQYFFWRQLGAVVLGAVAFFIMSRVPYRLFLRFATILLALALLANILLWIAGSMGWGIAQCTGGACRWLNIGTSLQPSELLKVALIFWLPSFLAHAREQGKIDDWATFGIVVGVVGLALFLVVITQSDFGTGAVLAAISLALLFFSGLSYKKVGLLLLAGLLAGSLIFFGTAYRRERFMTFLRGEEVIEETTAESYHAKQAYMAIGTGGLLGVGLANSVYAAGYLPESLNDSIFAVFGEIFGFVGLLVILSLFLWLLIRVLRTSALQHDYAARLIALGVFVWILVQVLINTGAMSGAIPMKGIVLPLLSYGGTSMLIMLTMLGLVFQLSRFTGREVVKPGEGINARPTRRRRERGSSHPVAGRRRYNF